MHASIYNPKCDAKSIVEEEKEKYARYKADYEKQHSWPSSPDANLDPITPDGSSSKGYHSDPTRQAGGTISPEQSRLIHHERQPAIYMEPFDESETQRSDPSSSGVDSNLSSCERKSKLKTETCKPVYTIAAINKDPPGVKREASQSTPSKDYPHIYASKDYPQTYPSREAKPQPVLGSPARGRRAWAEGKAFPPEDANAKRDHEMPHKGHPKHHKHPGHRHHYQDYKNQQAVYKSQEDLSWEQQEESSRLSYQDPKDSHRRDMQKYHKPPHLQGKKYNDYVNIEVFWNQQRQHEPRHQSYLPPAGERAVLPPGNQRNYNGHHDHQQWQQERDDGYYYYEKETNKYPMPQQSRSTAEPQWRPYEIQERRMNEINASQYPASLRDRPSSAPVVQPQDHQYFRDKIEKSHHQQLTTDQQPEGLTSVSPGQQSFQGSSKDVQKGSIATRDVTKSNNEVPRTKESPKFRKESPKTTRDSPNIKKGSPRGKGDRQSRKEQHDATKQLEGHRRRSWNENLPDFQRTIAVHTPSPSPDRRKTRRSWSRERPQSEHGISQESNKKPQQSEKSTGDVLKEAGVYFSKAVAKSQEDLVYQHSEPSDSVINASPLQTPTSSAVSISFPKATKDTAGGKEDTYVEVSQILSMKNLQRQHSDPPLTQKSCVSIPISGSPNYKQEVAFSLTGVRKDFVGPPKRHVSSSTQMHARPASTDSKPPDETSQPNKFHITVRSKSYDDLDCEDNSKVDLNVIKADLFQDKNKNHRNESSDVKNELHLVLNKTQGTVEHLSSEVFHAKDKMQESMTDTQQNKEDDEDRPIYDYVSYKDGEKYPKANIQDALTELEETFEALNLDKDIDEEFAASKPEVKRLSITNLKSFEEIQPKAASPSMDYARQWLGGSQKSKDEVKAPRLADASPASMEVAALSLPPDPQMLASSIHARSSSAGSEVKYYVTGVQHYPKRKSDDMAYRKTKTTPKQSVPSQSPVSTPSHPRTPEQFYDNASLRQRSSSASKIEVLSLPTSTGYLQERTTSPRRGQLRSRPDKEADRYHEDMAYRKYRKDIPPVKTIIPDRYAQMRLEYSLRGRSQSLEGLRDQTPPYRDCIEPKITYSRHRSDSSYQQEEKVAPHSMHQYESQRRVYGSAPDLFDSSVLSDSYSSDDPRYPRSAVKVRKQQTPRTVKQRHEMRVKIKHLRSGPDSYIYAVDSETDSPTSSGNEQQLAPHANRRTPPDGAISDEKDLKPKKNLRIEPPLPTQIGMRKTYYDNTQDLVSQESKCTYLIDLNDEPVSKSPTSLPVSHHQSFHNEVHMPEVNMHARPAPIPQKTYLTEDFGVDSSSSQRTPTSPGKVTQVKVQHITNPELLKKPMRVAETSSRSSDKNNKSPTKQTPYERTSVVPPQRPQQPTKYQPQEQIEGFPGPLSILTDKSQVLLQTKLQEVKRAQDTSAESKLVEAYEAKIKQMREERKKQRPYSMTDALEKAEWPKSRADKQQDTQEVKSGIVERRLAPQYSMASLEVVNPPASDTSNTIHTPKAAQRPEVPERSPRLQQGIPGQPQRHQSTRPNVSPRPELPQRSNNQVRVESLSVMASKPDVVRDTEVARPNIRNVAAAAAVGPGVRDTGVVRPGQRSQLGSSKTQSSSISTQQLSTSSSSLATSYLVKDQMKTSLSSSHIEQPSGMVTSGVAGTLTPTLTPPPSYVQATSFTRPIPVMHDSAKKKTPASALQRDPGSAGTGQPDARDTAARLVQSASHLPVHSQTVISESSTTEQKTHSRIESSSKPKTTVKYSETSRVFRPVEAAKTTETGIPRTAIARPSESGIPKSAQLMKQTTIQSSQKKTRTSEYEMKESKYSSQTKSKIPSLQPVGKASQQSSLSKPSSSSNVTRTTVGMSKSSLSSFSSQKQKMQIVVQHEKSVKQSEKVKLTGNQQGSIKWPVSRDELQSPPADGADDSFETLDSLVARQPENMSADELEFTDNENLTDDTDAHTDIMVDKAMGHSKKPTAEDVKEEEYESDTTHTDDSEVSDEEKSSRRRRRHLEPERRRSIKELVSSFESKMDPFMKATSIPMRRCTSHESISSDAPEENLSLKDMTGSAPDLAAKVVRRPPKKPSARKDRSKVVSSNW